MKEKGFTLVELLAVIIILAVIALIATPLVLDVVDDAKKSAFESGVYGVIESIKLDISDNILKGESLINEYNFPTSELELQGIQPEGGIAKTDRKGKVSIAVYDEKWCATKAYDEGTLTVTDYVEGECIIAGELDLYKDESKANVPELLDNMIPVKYENGSWVYASLYEKWYDYDEGQWANAVVLKKNPSKKYKVNNPISMDDIALMYVWIPRYTYTIFNGNDEISNEQEIKIKFEAGTESSGTVSCVDAINTKDAEGNIIAISETCTDDTYGSIENGKSTYTHPAFTFGGKKLTGFWIGKFEVSGTTDAITIKPNADSLRNTSVSDFFTAIQNINTIYKTNGDSHMIKNMEWGAVAYLKQSEYGLGVTDIGINNYKAENGAKCKTGCGAESGSNSSETCNEYHTETGMLASTTGNIYGVYDMSGGAFEYTMGNMVDKNGNFYSNGTGFTTVPDSKYYDIYTYAESNLIQGRGKLGDATKETLKIAESSNGEWNSDYSTFPNSTHYWFMRGGYSETADYSGVFTFLYNTGGAGYQYGTRAVLTP